MVNTTSLRQDEDPDRFIHKYMDRDGVTKECILPSQEITSLNDHEDVQLLPSDERCGMQFGQPSEIEEDSPTPPPHQDDPYHLNKYDLPKFDFVAKTKTEKMLSSVIKFQRKINKWQAYAIGKLFKKVKKLQPADCVSSEDEFLARSGESSNDDQDDNDEDNEEGYDEGASSSSRATNPIDPPHRSLQVPLQRQGKAPMQRSRRKNTTP